MDIVQSFYDDLAPNYDKLFNNFNETTIKQGEILNSLFKNFGFDTSASLLDCACGIGTQSLGLATLGYNVTASDVSVVALENAKQRAKKINANINFCYADFRNLNLYFKQNFDIVIAMDNALPHMLTPSDLKTAINSISNKTAKNGVFIASIRDYDELLKSKPPYSPPYIHKTQNGKRVSFQTWTWKGDNYELTQYIIEDEKTLKVSKYNCEYRAVTRQELTNLLLESGFSEVKWLFPTETDFYQPIVVAKKTK